MDTTKDLAKVLLSTGIHPRELFSKVQKCIDHANVQRKVITTSGQYIEDGGTDALNSTCEYSLFDWFLLYHYLPDLCEGDGRNDMIDLLSVFVANGAGRAHPEVKRMIDLAEKNLHYLKRYMIEL